MGANLANCEMMQSHVYMKQAIFQLFLYDPGESSDVSLTHFIYSVLKI